jgi:F-type H+-transporting ATPase subunit epsilon
MSLTVRVVAPDKTVWDAEAEEVILPSTTGQLGVLSGHAPLLTALEVGVMQVRPEKDWMTIALMGGFAEVENNEVTILVNGAERGDTIDLESARTAFETAKAALDATSTEDKSATMKATNAFRRARARFQAAGGMA